MMKRDNPEHRLHLQVAAFLRVALQLPTFWTTFPAGGGGRTRGALLKAAGLKPGVPDILVIHPRPTDGGCIVLGIELKAEHGRRSIDQTATHAVLREAGVHTVVCHTVEQVAAALDACGVPLRATVMAGGGFKVAA